MSSGNDVNRLRGQNSDSNARTCFACLGNNCSVAGVIQEVRITGRLGGYLLAGAFDCKNHALPIWDHGGQSKEECVYP